MAEDFGRPSVRLIGLAAAAHQGSPPICLPPLLICFPAKPWLLWSGIGGRAGGIGGMLIAKVVGYVLQATGSDLIPFLISGSA